MPLMSPTQIARGLDDRFRLLTAGTRTATQRQKTLLDALDWSFALVSDFERVVLRRLAVWPGTWTLDDAVALAGAEFARWDVVEAVGSLVDRSLVVALPAAERADRRYRLLYSTGDYAHAKLIEAGESDAARRRQAERVDALLAAAEDGWRGNDETALRTFEAPPIRAALRWAITLRSDPALGANLAGRSAMFWSLRLLHFEGLRWIADALANLPEDAIAARTTALIGLARLYKPMLRRRETYDAAAEAMLLADRAGDTKAAAIARTLIADPTAVFGNVAEGRRRLDEAAERFASIGDQRGLDSTYWQSAVLAHRYGDHAVARERFETMIARYRERGMLRLTASATIGIAEVEFASGNTRAAIDRALEAVADARTIADAVEVGTALQNLAAYYLDTGAVRDATAAARESLAFFSTHGYHMQADISIGHLADALARDGRETDAAVLLGYCNERVRKSGAARGTTERRGYERTSATCSRVLGSREYELCLDEGAAIDIDEAAALALSLTSDA
jgi:tetratricopeptide (TPR) repeat protein